MCLHQVSVLPREAFLAGLLLFLTPCLLAQERRLPQEASEPGPYLELPVDIYQDSSIEGQQAAFKLHNRADQVLTAITLKVSCISAGGPSEQVQTNDWAVSAAIPPGFEISTPGPLAPGMEKTISVAVPSPTDTTLSECDAVEVTPLAIVLGDASALGSPTWIRRTFESRVEELRVQQSVASAIQELLHAPDVAESVELRLEELRGISARSERAPRPGQVIERETEPPGRRAAERKLEQVLRTHAELHRKVPTTSIEMLLQRELLFTRAYIEGLSKNLPPHMVREEE